MEIYGLQTPKEVLSHEDKYHIKKDKSLFNLSTPLKKLKKMESKFVVTPSSNPVNALNIRKSKFGRVGYTTITIETLKNKSFKLEEVPKRFVYFHNLQKIEAYELKIDSCRVNLIITLTNFN